MQGRTKLSTLGAILAGGKSSRFGSDKGQALLNGRALIDHVRSGLAQQVDTLISVGRKWPGLRSISDRPMAGMGPLGGLCSALHFAAANGFDRILTSPCDALPIPDNIQSHFPLTGGVFFECPLIGIWPATLARTLDEHMASTKDLSMRHWLAVSKIAVFPSPFEFANFNKPDDLEKFISA